MKKGHELCIFIIVLTLAFGYSASGQTIIENRDSPILKNPARVLQTEEIFRVADKGEGFYFKFPWGFAVLNDDSFAVGDETQLLKFGPDGIFAKNLVRTGQGPGEIANNFCALQTDGDNLFIKDHNQDKIIHLKGNGDFVREIRPGDFASNNLFGHFLGVRGNRFFFADSTWPPPAERTGRLLEVVYRILVQEKGTVPERALATFRPKTFMMPRGAMGWDPFIAVLGEDGRSVLVNWTQVYQIDKVDLETGSIIATFRRPFPRLPHAKGEWEDEWKKKYDIPERKFDSDITDILPNKDSLWVKTSQTDKNKGRLYDVYDGEGRLLDSFFIKDNLDIKALRGRFIYALEETEEGALSLVKLRVSDPKYRLP